MATRSLVSGALRGPSLGTSWHQPTTGVGPPAVAAAAGGGRAMQYRYGKGQAVQPVWGS